MAYQAADALREAFAQRYPSAVVCFEDDLDACLQHLQCPAKHRKSISTTNMVERSFGEEKRRSKVIPRFFDEKSGLTLVFASLIRASQSLRKLKFTFEEQAQILALRDRLGHKAIKERRMIIKNQRKSQKNARHFSRGFKT